MSELFANEYRIATEVPLKILVGLMATKKMLGVGNRGTQVYSTTSSLSLLLSLTGQVVIDNQYVCDMVATPKEVISEMRVGYMAWGPLSTMLDELLTSYDESGIVLRIQNLITYRLLVKERVKWEILVESLQLTKALEINSPLGRACLMQVFSSVVILGCFLLAHLLQLVRSNSTKVIRF